MFKWKFFNIPFLARKRCCLIIIRKIGAPLAVERRDTRWRDPTEPGTAWGQSSALQRAFFARDKFLERAAHVGAGALGENILRA